MNPLPIEVPRMTEILQWHKCHDQDPAYVWLRRVFNEQAAKLPTD